MEGTLYSVFAQSDFYYELLLWYITTHILHADPLATLTLQENGLGVDYLSISWSSPAQSVCEGISYYITLSIILNDDSHEMLDTLTNITLTHYSFTGLYSSTVYLVEVMPIYNGVVRNVSNITVRTKDQLTSTLISM